jgi:NAD(P)-dependent dehydrogenase (short-subunit alcohol dehydrogenase family)
MLDDKVAIVTGGSTGIGRAIAEKYVEYGAEVVIANRNEDAGETTANELGCIFQQCDVSEYGEVESLVETTVEEYDRLDVMVNNAGIGRAGTIEELTLEEWDDVIQINLSGVMYGSRAALPHLKQTDGCIINVASIYGLVGGPGSAAYSAAKGGVVNLTRETAVDYASEGVRVNSICPGFVETPMTDEYLEQGQFYEFVRGQTPMGRVAKPEEIGGIAMFLASDEASYITGTNVPVDGGWTAH